MLSQLARCPSVCPSVCLSHAGITLKLLNIASDLFSPNVITIFRRAIECREYEKMAILVPIFISEMIQDSAIVTVECEWETVPNGRLPFTIT